MTSNIVSNENDFSFDSDVSCGLELSDYDKYPLSDLQKNALGSVLSETGGRHKEKITRMLVWCNKSYFDGVKKETIHRFIIDTIGSE